MSTVTSGQPDPVADAWAAGPPLALREPDVFSLASRGLLEAALDYVLLGRVRRPRRRGAVIAAEVEGSESTYCARASLAAGGPVQITPACDCPSQRPFCKHVLALLLLWTREPQAFLSLDTAEAVLARRPAAVVAALLAEAAMGGGDPLEALALAGHPPDWDGLPPGRCLEDWQAFAAWGELHGRWPEAALTLGARIAGPPGRPPTDGGAQAAVVSRQLAWWLTNMTAVLPPPALLPWLSHLAARLEGAARRADAAALAPELAVHLARLATALPEERAAERRWLAHFAAAAASLGPVFEAETERLLWSAETAIRLAVSPAVPDAAPGGPATADRCRAVLAVLRGQ